MGMTLRNWSNFCKCLSLFPCKGGNGGGCHSANDSYCSTPAVGMRPFHNSECAFFVLVRVCKGVGIGPSTLQVCNVGCGVLLWGIFLGLKTFQTSAHCHGHFTSSHAPWRQPELSHSLCLLLRQILFTEAASISDGNKLTGFCGGYWPFRFAQTTTR